MSLSRLRLDNKTKLRLLNCRRFADSTEDFFFYFWIFFEEQTGAVNALAEALFTEVIPGTGLCHHSKRYASIYQVGMTGNAFIVEYVKLSRAKRRSHLVLFNLGNMPIADYLFPRLNLGGAP